MSDDLEYRVQMCELHDAKKCITEIRGRKDLQKEAKKGPVRCEKRGLDDSEKGHIMERLIGTRELMRIRGSRKTAKSHLETMGIDGQNVSVRREINEGITAG